MDAELRIFAAENVAAGRGAARKLAPLAAILSPDAEAERSALAASGTICKQ